MAESLTARECIARALAHTAYGSYEHWLSQADWFIANAFRDLPLADLASLLRDAGYDVTLLVPPQAPEGDRLVVAAKKESA